MIVFEYFFFGFFAIPIMKMLLQTYDWERDEKNNRVLRRANSWGKFIIITNIIECESWQQLSLFGCSIITLSVLIIGAVIRNLAKEEEMHFKTNEWRIKQGINKLLIKEMILKAIIMIIAIFGPRRYYFPSLICWILAFCFMIYWLKYMPYVLNKYNHIVKI